MNELKIGITATEYPDTSLEDIFTAAKKFGAGSIEMIVPKNMSGKDVPRVKELIVEYGIGISCITPQVELNLPGLDIKREQEKIIEAISIAAELKAGYVVTYTGGNGERSFNQAVEEYTCNISPCVKEAEKKRITIVLENEFNFAGPDPTETPEGCIEIIKIRRSILFFPTKENKG